LARKSKSREDTTPFSLPNCIHSSSVSETKRKMCLLQVWLKKRAALSFRIQKNAQNQHQTGL
ncbi:MAG: hypothetical protein E6736_27055, partial [Leclercia adecarboxylata]|nr:hypothetical protein [Leclercia adecarboxylata]